MDTLKDILIRRAPVWNVGNNLAQYLTWADNIAYINESEEIKIAGSVLRGFGYILCGKISVRPSIKRFLQSATPEQIVPWLLKGIEHKVDVMDVHGFMNRLYRESAK